MGSPDMDDDLDLSDCEIDSLVRNSIRDAVQGNCDYYHQIVSVLHSCENLGPADTAALVECLNAVTLAVSSIKLSHHTSLLAAIFGMSLWNYGTDVMDALVKLIFTLASSTGDYVDLCLEMLVANFMPPINQHRALAKKTLVLDRVHSTLNDIANVVPLSPLRLEKIVRDRMPKIYMKEAFIVLYVENMLRLEGGAMGGSTILVVLVDRLIELDVEIAWDDIMQDDFQKGIFDMELEDFEGHADHIEQDCNELSREAFIQRFFSGNLTAEKLDSLMVLTFEHINSCFDSGRLVQVFGILLQSFQTTILTAYKAKFTQFIIFYACSLDPENCGKLFARTLIDIFVGRFNPEWRISAVAYLASYLARAKFVPVTFVAETLKSVVDWCSHHCENHGGDVNRKFHKVFYAGCQAIMYVLCFRMRQMVVIPRLKSKLERMPIEDILLHPLKPLQVCLPSIVDEFLRLAKANRVFSSLTQSYVDFGLIESEQARALGGTERFDMFFPFDPCLLRKCDRYIRPCYVYWSMVRNTYNDGEGDTSDEEGAADVAYEGGNGMSIPGGRSYEDEGNSDGDEFDLDKMSITPRDSCNKFGGRKQRFMQMPSKIRPSTSPESL